MKNETEAPWKGPRPVGLMGPGRPACPILSPPRVLLSPQVFWSLSLSRLHPIGRRYLRDIFEGKDKTENPSLNLYLLCLAPKYLDLILWALSFGFHWRVDVHEWASVIMTFGPLFGLWPCLSSCYRVIMVLIISCSKIGQKPAKTKYL